jgi:hypothetical protein
VERTVLLDQKMDNKQMPQEKTEEKTEERISWIPDTPPFQEKKSYADIVRARGQYTSTADRGHEEVSESISGSSNSEETNTLPENPLASNQITAMDTSSNKSTERIGCLMSDVHRYNLSYYLERHAKATLELGRQMSTINFEIGRVAFENCQYESLNRKLMLQVAELQREITMRSFDLSLFKEVIEQQENSRTASAKQLAFLTDQVVQLKIEHTNSLNREHELKKVIEEYKRKEKPWN